MGGEIEKTLEMNIVVREGGAEQEQGPDGEVAAPIWYPISYLAPHPLSSTSSSLFGIPSFLYGAPI